MIARYEYKETWNALADTPERAALHVLGNSDEVSIKHTALDTLSHLKSTVGIEETDIVLEIGCGIGRVGQVVAPLCYKWIGVDVSSNMLKHAAVRLRHLDNTQLVETSGFDLSSIASNSVNLVYCTVVFMHLDEWDRYTYVKEAHRILMLEGRFYVDNFNLCSNEGWEVFERTRSQYQNPTHRPAHISKSSTPQEIMTYLCRAGFRNASIKTNGLWVRGWGEK